MATITELVSQSADSPDEVRPFHAEMGHVQLVHLPTGDVGRGTFAPGWRWSEHVKPLAGTDSCQVDHIGYVVSGHMHVVTDAGREIDLGPGDFFHIPPGHDAWTVGEEPCVQVDFGGLHGYAQAH